MDWNEIEFLSWGEFKQMAPSILQLEISRIGKLIEVTRPEMEIYNALVQARFEMKKFIEHLEKILDRPSHKEWVAPLNKAILVLSALNIECDSHAGKKIAYILDRLHYVVDRSRLLY